MAVSTPDDFKRAAEQRRKDSATELRLPSGLVVLASQPSLDWWIREVGRLPQSMAARLMGVEANGDGLSTETIIQFSRWTARLVETVVLSPKIRLNPQADDEIDANVISDDDLAFLVRFAGGEVSASGAGLDTFPGERRSSPQSSAGS